MMIRLIKKNSLSLIAIPFLFAAKVSLATTCPTDVTNPNGTWKTSFPDGFTVQSQLGKPTDNFPFEAMIITSSLDMPGNIACRYNIGPSSSLNGHHKFYLILSNSRLVKGTGGAWLPPMHLIPSGSGFLCSISIQQCTFDFQ